MNATEVFDQHAVEYDAWFDANALVYQAEVEAVRALLPSTGVGLEIGVGTGRFHRDWCSQVTLEHYIQEE